MVHLVMPYTRSTCHLFVVMQLLAVLLNHSTNVFLLCVTISSRCIDHDPTVTSGPIDVAPNPFCPLAGCYTVKHAINISPSIHNTN